MEANRRTTKACRLIVCGIPLSCFALDNYRVPIKILLEGHVCWRKWARSKPRQVRSLAKLASNRPSPLSLPLSSSLHEAVALLFFFSFSIEPRVKRNTRRKDSFFHSRIRFKYIYRKKRENVYEGYLDSVEGSLSREEEEEWRILVSRTVRRRWRFDRSPCQRGCGNPPKLCVLPELSSSSLRSCLIIQSGKLKGEACFQVNTSWLGEIV